MPANRTETTEQAAAERRERSDRRETVVDRRSGTDRRQQQVAFEGPDRRSGKDRRSGLERRRGPGRRRSDSRRTAEEGEMNDEQFDFLMAIDEYKKVNHRPFPTWTEVLDIIHALGYRKVADSQKIR
ncbi:MAG: hypothetical protein ACOC93_03020 [Planctomycetota bacterium]